MGIEIERKFLVPRSFPEGEKQYFIKQGYLNPLQCTIHVSSNSLHILDNYNFIYLNVNIGTDSKSLLKDIANDGKGILSLNEHNIARVRLRDNEGFITIKGLTSPLGTPEYEYGILSISAEKLLEKFADKYIHKIRHIIPFKGKKWEVDEFISPVNFILAEIELTDTQEDLIIPSWVGKEVTGDHRYSNSNIIKMKSYSAVTQEFTS